MQGQSERFPQFWDGHAQIQGYGSGICRGAKRILSPGKPETHRGGRNTGRRPVAPGFYHQCHGLQPAGRGLWRPGRSVWRYQGSLCRNHPYAAGAGANLFRRPVENAARHTLCHPPQYAGASFHHCPRESSGHEKHGWPPANLKQGTHCGRVEQDAPDRPAFHGFPTLGRHGSVERIPARTESAQRCGNR